MHLRTRLGQRTCLRHPIQLAVGVANVFEVQADIYLG